MSSAPSNHRTPHFVAGTRAWRSLARSARRASPPASEAPRPRPIWAVASHTERKTTTWVASPQATAMHASMTGPSWPAVSIVPPNQDRRSPSALAG